MDSNYTKSGWVPSNIDFDEILNSIEGNVTKKRYLKDGMVYFLSQLVKDNYYIYESKDEFRTLNEKILSNIIGKDRPSLIVKLLKSHGIIEVRKHKKGKESRGYKLTDKYIWSDYIEIDFSERIQSKLKEHQKKLEIEKKKGKVYYHYIFKQFDKNHLEIDRKKLDLYLRNLSEKLFQRHKRLRKNQDLNYNSITNFIGRCIAISEDINKERFRLSIAKSNNRFHSNITSLPKIIRPFLKINGEHIGEVDIKCSQPYFLSVLLKNYFLENNNTLGLELIYPEMDNLFGNMKILCGLQNGHKDRIFILGRSFSKEYSTKLKEFTNYDFSNDWYQYIYDRGLEVNYSLISSSKKFNQGRKYIKKHVMNFLNEKDLLVREKNKVIQLIGEVYPELNSVLNKFYFTFKSNNIALLLQRIESYLMLNQVCSKIEEYDSIPYFTIHDCILTSESYLEEVKKIVYERITDYTGKPVGLTTKIYTPKITVSERETDDIWIDLKITSLEQYEKKKTYILPRNINLGKEFLNI